MATNRELYVTAIMGGLLDHRVAWPEDAVYVARAMAKAADDMLTKVESEQPGALHSHAYYRFVAAEFRTLAARCTRAWRPDQTSRN